MTRTAQDFARDMAILAVHHWRDAKARKLPKATAAARRDALFFMAAAKRAW